MAGGSVGLEEVLVSTIIATGVAKVLDASARKKSIRMVSTDLDRRICLNMEEMVRSNS